MKKSLLSLLCASALLSGCASGERASGDGVGDASPGNTSSSAPAPTTSTPREPSPEEIAEQKAKDAVPDSQRMQVASLMTVGVNNFDQALDVLHQGAGGIFIGNWTDTSILTEPGRDIAALREIIGRPFSVSIDFEGGRVQRASNVFGEYPSPRQMAQTMTPEQVEELAAGLGESFIARGVTVDFAPVLDVDTYGLDVVGDRAFSSDPHEAATYASAFARGLNRAGVAAVYKHFPGHGRASGDSHHQHVVTPHLDELKSLELLPYGPALDGANAAVMVGHMDVPGLGTPGVPASLDPATYGLVRSGDYPGGAPFDGVIYTDDLSGMAMISDMMGAPQAALESLKAGADQALWIDPGSLTYAIDLVDSAVTVGEYPKEQMLESALRVQRLNVSTGQ